MKAAFVFVYDQEIRFHKDLIGAKFVDSPSILTRYAKIVFVCQPDSTEKIQQCTGKHGLFYVCYEVSFRD